MNAQRVDNMPHKWSNLTSREFEWLCAIALKKQGYKRIQLTPQTQDEGIDVIASYLNKTWGVEVKQRSDGTVGRPVVQQLFGATQAERMRGIVMTNAKFSSTAKDFAQKSNIILMSGDKLKKWVKDADVRKARQYAEKEKESNVNLDKPSFLDDIFQSIFGSAKNLSLKVIKAPVTVPKKTIRTLGGLVSSVTSLTSRKERNSKK